MMPSFVHAVYDFFEFAQPEECLFCCLCVGTCKFISQILYYFRIFTYAWMTYVVFDVEAIYSFINTIKNRNSQAGFLA